VLSALDSLARDLADHVDKWGRRFEADPPRLLTARAGAAGLSRAGRISAGGSCRLLSTGDGRWVAVNLPRPADREAVPAVTGRPADGDPWTHLARAARRTPAASFVEQARLLEVPAAALAELSAGDPLPPWWSERQVGPLARAPAAPLVIDLSAMWAGPLCASLLAAAGARVIKVESRTRPDGARFGPPAFFDSLHDGHKSVVLALDESAGRRALHQLIGAADVIIDSSRPRAMDQLGIDPEAIVSARPGRTWVSVTAYGRTGPLAQTVGFGDDAAVAGGLVAWDTTGRPVFCADAIADPIAGLAAGAAAAAAIANGGGRMVEVALRDVAARAAREHPARPGRAVRDEYRWRLDDATRTEIAPPRPPPPPRFGGARPAGADTIAVLSELGIA
jgi:CoA-transferase family III